MNLYQRILAVVVSVPLVILMSSLIRHLRILQQSGLNYYFEDETVRLIALLGMVSSFILLTIVLVFSLSRVMMYFFDRYWNR